MRIRGRWEKRSGVNGVTIHTRSMNRLKSVVLGCAFGRLRQRRFGVLYKARTRLGEHSSTTKTLVERFRLWNRTRISFWCRRVRL